VKIFDNVILSEVMATHRAMFFLTDLIEDDDITATHMNILEKAEESTKIPEKLVVRLKCRWYDKKKDYVQHCSGRSTFQ